jgi:alkanesulfonate monooxygenase SsuD/methylene tetrahydromethanopterin reductase-like flavin-dependent oxidoreductase (luciferase family)
VPGSLIPHWAAQAEQAGFAALGTVGRVAYPGIMDTVALSAAAGATSSIELISTVLIGPVWPEVLLAKELAGIDAVSGARLTVGLGVGQRADDFVAEGLGLAGRGTRLDEAVSTFLRVWSGNPVGGGTNPAVRPGTRMPPLLMGGFSPPAFRRMAARGEGYIAGTVPPPMVGEAFDAARAAWTGAGRPGTPRLVATCYFVFGDTDTGRANTADYYAGNGPLVDLVVSSIRVGADQIRDEVKEIEDLGADELILLPCLADPSEVDQLAETVL